MSFSVRATLRQKIGMSLLGLSFFLSVFVPFFYSYTYDQQNLEQRLISFSAQHWMGTDMLGRDLLIRVLHGMRLSLAVGFCAAVLALLFGAPLGVVAGYSSGILDRLLMRMVDFFFVFPSLLLGALVILILGQSFWAIVLAIALTGWMPIARVARAQALHLKKQTFVEAAKVIGASNWRILTKHLLPHLKGPVLIAVLVQIPNYILTESFLSFIGLGLQPPEASLGSLASEGWKAMQAYPHLLVFPGLALFLILLAFQALEPTSRH